MIVQIKSQNSDMKAASLLWRISFILILLNFGVKFYWTISNQSPIRYSISNLIQDIYPVYFTLPLDLNSKSLPATMSWNKVLVAGTLYISVCLQVSLVLQLFVSEPRCLQLKCPNELAGFWNDFPFESSKSWTYNSCCDSFLLPDWVLLCF